MHITMSCTHLSCKDVKCMNKVVDMTQQEFDKYKKMKQVADDEIIYNCPIMEMQVFKIISVDNRVLPESLQSSLNHAISLNKKLKSMRVSHKQAEDQISSELDEIANELFRNGADVSQLKEANIDKSKKVEKKENKKENKKDISDSIIKRIF